jgi:hypothetical protein
MKVRELIEVLAKFNPDLPVMGDLDGHEGDVYEVAGGKRDDFFGTGEEVVWIRTN